MSTLSMFSSNGMNIPATTGWLLADLGECLGKQELFLKRSPQRLQTLREHAIIESAVSSNRIEGVEVELGRLRDVLASPKPAFRDRNEEEVRGYREALDLIHRDASALPITEDFIRRLHRLARGDIWDAGEYKSKDSDIIERLPDGRHRVRFRTVRAADTPTAMTRLISEWTSALEERRIHPLIAMAAFNLDFLCIHPFRDGNGRVSRLLLLLHCYHLGFEVGRYVSLERLIEESKDRYYGTLELSSHGWHEDRHDSWPYIDFLLFILLTAYRELESGMTTEPLAPGAKTRLVLEAVERLPLEFSLRQLQDACPEVSPEMVRTVLRRQKGESVEPLGRGPGAKWRKIGGPDV